MSQKTITRVPFRYLIFRLVRIKKHLLQEIESLHGKYGDVFGIQVDNLKCFIRRPDLIKYVLVDNHLNYSKGVGFKLFHDVIGFGLLTSDGKKWLDERKILSTEFLGQNHRQSELIVEEELREIQHKWRQKDSINLTYDLNELMVRTTCRILFDYEFNDDLDEVRNWFHDYDHFIGRQQRSFVKLPMWMPLPYLKRAKRAATGLRHFARKIKDTCLRSDRPNMIKRMVQAGFSDDTVFDHILTFFIAGHETTANSINFTFLLLRDNPIYFERLKQEVRNHDLTDKLDELECLDTVIKESLRLYPTIPLFPRIANEDDQLGEFQIKKGDMIAFSPWIIHRCEKFWESPLVFKPERFVGKKYEKDYIYFPFGLGPRKCIGATLSTLQMKKIISFIFANFDFTIQGPSLEHYNHNVSLSPVADVMLKRS